MAHDDLTREHRVEGASDRAFGLLFAVVAMAVALWPLWHRQPVRGWALGVAAALGLVAWLRPSLLSVPNRWWLRLGLLLGRLVSPIALGLLFYLVLFPIGSLMRLSGKDSLRLRREPDAKSYWIARTPPGPPRDSMENQF